MGYPLYSPPYQLDIGLLSDIGRSRTINQDDAGVIQLADNSGVLAYVADGMGGYNGGEIASQTAGEILQRMSASKLTEQNCAKSLLAGFTEANSAIYQLAEHSLELKSMGTTLVALVILEEYAFFANTGDSRLYLFRDHKTLQLSEDHSIVAELVRSGLITPAQAKQHPHKHVITHAVGVKPDVYVDISNTPVLIKPDDHFLLCSDGLYELVEDNEMLAIVSQHPAQVACEQLIQLANSRGGYDNISALIVHVIAK